METAAEHEPIGAPSVHPASGDALQALSALIDTLRMEQQLADLFATRDASEVVVVRADPRSHLRCTPRATP
jgi:hypothetical protein